MESSSNDENYLGVLCDELLLKIMESLRPKDLCNLSRLSKSLNRVSNDPSLWEKICEERVENARLESLMKVSSDIERYLASSKGSVETNTKLFWKKSYFASKYYVMKRFSPMCYVAALMDRRGTGDSWIHHIGDWKHHFQYYMQKEYSIKLTSEGEIFYKGLKIGSYQLIEQSQLLDEYGDMTWLKAIEDLKECPYLGGLIGFISWSVKPEYGLWFMMRMVEVSRGVVVQVNDTSKYMKCIAHHIYPLSQLIDEKYRDTILLMVNLQKCQQKPKYLQDILDEVNVHFSKRHAKLISKKAPEEKLPTENLNRGVPKKKPLVVVPLHRKEKIPPKHPCVLDFAVPSGPNGKGQGLVQTLIGREYYDFPELFKSSRIGIWGFTPTFRTALLGVLTYEDTKDSFNCPWKPYVAYDV